VLHFIRSYGYRSSHTYTAFSNPEMRVLLLPGVGCMVYTTAACWGLKVVVATGDPICDPQHDLLMLETFKAIFPAGVMLDTSKDIALLWAGEEAKQRGPPMTVTDMGTEIAIADLQNYDFEFNKVCARAWGVRCRELENNTRRAPTRECMELHACSPSRFCGVYVCITWAWVLHAWYSSWTSEQAWIGMCGAACWHYQLCTHVHKQPPPSYRQTPLLKRPSPMQRTKEIRRNADKATRAGLIVEELTAHSSAAVKEQVQQLAAQW
jgi:hypothetical protein